ncbi:hypothetical protein B0T11DRAFT_329591 [Plectosphaerella cucumerina]|uniref:Uncharacterized protein n=1 Tax=Plectosphaerella cucumerina TaxID=40658 RepID=A0A8K0TFV6_9PEZI|nr:hypothetical protein B0T11DRAFT_329591 [Plectosphaerella cucumerina]
MVAVREEMAGSMRKYAEPVTGSRVLSHQVQYLGTDRRLTYSMLSQGKHLRTLFVPNAISETVAPQSLQYYLRQRRRLGSNAYLNNYFYLAGENMVILTRIAAAIEVIRLSFVYYRILNTALFIHRMTTGIDILALLPMLIAPAMSAAIFAKVALNLGSQAWDLVFTWIPSKLQRDYIMKLQTITGLAAGLATAHLASASSRFASKAAHALVNPKPGHHGLLRESMVKLGSLKALDGAIHNRDNVLVARQGTCDIGYWSPL